MLLIFTTLTSWSKEQKSTNNAQEQKQEQIMENARKLLQSGKVEEAIGYFEKVAAYYEKKYPQGKTQYFSARTQTESLAYLLAAAAEKHNAKVVSPLWADAYYNKAYALIELKQLAEAKLLLERALTLSPNNSIFLSELGHIYQAQHDWPQALQVFKSAETASEFSPPNVKNSELALAWRGIGYVFVEQNRLDEAEEIYRKCLALDNKDFRAFHELQYVQSLKTKLNTQ